MQDIKMEVYTPALELPGILEGFSGFQYEECAFSAGSFLVDAPLTDTTRAMLVAENIIWFTGEVAGIIESLEEQAGQDGDSLTPEQYAGVLTNRGLEKLAEGQMSFDEFKKWLRNH